MTNRGLYWHIALKIIEHPSPRRQQNAVPLNPKAVLYTWFVMRIIRYRRSSRFAGSWGKQGAPPGISVDVLDLHSKMRQKVSELFEHEESNAHEPKEISRAKLVQDSFGFIWRIVWSALRGSESSRHPVLMVLFNIRHFFWDLIPNANFQDAVLVCTDIAARGANVCSDENKSESYDSSAHLWGLDVPDVSAVIHFQVWQCVLNLNDLPALSVTFWSSMIILLFRPHVDQRFLYTVVAALHEQAAKERALKSTWLANNFGSAIVIVWYSHSYYCCHYICYS